MSKLATTGVLAQLKQATVMTLSATGDGTGVSTLRFGVSSQITVTLNANAHFYTEPTGMHGESQTWTVTSGALRTIYLKCTSGTATLTISDASKINDFGDSSGQGTGWLSSTNAAQLTFDVSKLINLSNLRIEGNSVISGALPNGLTFLHLNGNSINWTYSGALPTGLTYLYLYGNLINWTYNAIEGTANFTYFELNNYRSSKMSSDDMVTLLDSIRMRDGRCCSSITINDYEDYTDPPQKVKDAKLALIAADKGVTTINLGE